MCSSRNCCLFLIFAVVFLVSNVCSEKEKNFLNLSPKELKDKTLKLPPCKSCNILVESFRKGLDRTSRGKHEGGDAAWEEEKLSVYSKSELRLAEIQEKLCSEVHIGSDQCHSLANEYELEIEDWWLRKQDEYPDIFDWFCVKHLKVCCPPYHYGPECKKCQDCNGNGKCKGSGTRKGNGQCACEMGYEGDNCNSCALGFYESFRDKNKLLCSSCHRSCNKDGCTGAGPKGCHKCDDGWKTDSEKGCIDINECLIKPKVCKDMQFCVNNDGSHSCLECDRSCNGCDGDGPDMCKECAEGYELRDGKCTEQLKGDHNAAGNEEPDTPSSSTVDSKLETKSEL